jgi:hypothetical protein
MLADGLLRQGGDVKEASTMRTYEVGATVKKGYYLNLKSFELLTIEREGGVLTGGGGGRFLRLPWPVLLVFAPAVGAGFVFFLPAIAFAMVLYYVSKSLYRLASRGVLALAPSGFGQVARGGAAFPAATQNETDRRKDDGGE